MVEKRRPYVYRERPYDYRENLIREASRNRTNEKQLRFTENEYLLIEEKMLEYGAQNFSEYIRDCVYNKNITKNDLEDFKKVAEKKNKRKKVFFSDEEIELINIKMDELDCNNFNVFITAIAKI